MTTTTWIETEETATRRHLVPSEVGTMNDGTDPLRAPAPTSTIAVARARRRVVLRGLVLHLDHLDTGHGPILEVTVSDGTDSLRLVFLGRHRIAGLDAGRVVTATGVLASSGSGRSLLNPQYWLDAPLVEVPDA